MSPGPVGDLESTDAESRRAARERALELLYEAEAKASSIDTVLDGLPVAPDALAIELARGVDAHRERIDEALARLVAPKWSLARLATVDRAILRIAAYELYEVPERSQALVINEAVLLARRFGTDDSARFVNGVLSSLAAEARPSGGDNAARARSSTGRSPAGAQGDRSAPGPAGGGEPDAVGPPDAPDSAISRDEPDPPGD